MSIIDKAVRLLAGATLPAQVSAVASLVSYVTRLVQDTRETLSDADEATLKERLADLRVANDRLHAAVTAKLRGGGA